MQKSEKIEGRSIWKTLKQVRDLFTSRHKRNSRGASMNDYLDGVNILNTRGNIVKINECSDDCPFVAW